ncbi:hypothetical protein KUD11_06890 [Roseovarius sp. LXJ103]|uniref:hypothetical protein n=1 Tax=Roseovarius carneus TaxID=2853164 RepID=UPI0011B237E3|nr:hypothetical protein [Roseovarius carneus]MBZ8118372.1 hypothetical protein [Roseovarius carneus]
MIDLIPALTLPHTQHFAQFQHHRGFCTETGGRSRKRSRGATDLSGHWAKWVDAKTVKVSDAKRETEAHSPWPVFSEEFSAEICTTRKEILRIFPLG